MPKLRCSLLLLSLLLACSRTVAPPPPTAARRIVSLSPALTEVLFAVGCGDRIVLRDGWSDFPEAARAIPAVRGFAPNAEAILAARPDLVLTHFPPPALRTALQGARVPWLSFAPPDLNGVAASIREVGKACGQPAAAEKLAAAFQARLAEVVRRVAARPKPRVFYEMDAGDGGRPYTIGAKAFGHAVLAAAGGANVFAQAGESWFQVSAESLLGADPDVILLADADSMEQPQSPASVAARPGWAALRAVRDGHVFPLHADWVSRPGPRLASGVEQIARLLHPEAFADLPPLTEARP